MNDEQLLTAVKDAYHGVHMRRTLETVEAAGRTRRRRTAGIRAAATAAVMTTVGAGAFGLSGLVGSTGPEVGRAPQTGAATQTSGQPSTRPPISIRTAAFTVVRHLDGSVTFTAEDVVAPAAATKALNDAGIAGRVVNGGSHPGCATTTADLDPADFYPADSNTRGFHHGEKTATIRSSDYPPGGGILVIVVDPEPPRGRPSVRDSHVELVIVAFNDATKIPTCIDSRDPGTGP